MGRRWSVMASITVVATTAPISEASIQSLLSRKMKTRILHVMKRLRWKQWSVASQRECLGTNVWPCSITKSVIPRKVNMGSLFRLHLRSTPEIEQDRKVLKSEGQSLNKRSGKPTWEPLWTKCSGASLSHLKCCSQDTKPSQRLMRRGECGSSSSASLWRKLTNSLLTSGPVTRLKWPKSTTPMLASTLSVSAWNSKQTPSRNHALYWSTPSKWKTKKRRERSGSMTMLRLQSRMQRCLRVCKKT